jgi:hypothetical protein
MLKGIASSTLAGMTNGGMYMKQLDSLEKYVVVPNVGFYGGFKYDGEDIMLCDDHDTDEGYDFKVAQKIVGDVLITDIERTYERKNGKKVTEKSHQEVEIEKGQLLVYVQGVGFTIPEYRMCLIDAAIEQYQLLKGN